MGRDSVGALGSNKNLHEPREVAVGLKTPRLTEIAFAMVFEQVGELQRVRVEAGGQDSGKAGIWTQAWLSMPVLAGPGAAMERIEPSNSLR